MSAGKTRGEVSVTNIYENGERIGLSSPQAKIHVQGDMKLTKNYNTIQLEDASNINFIIHNNTDRLHFIVDSDNNLEGNEGDSQRVVMYSMG